MKSGASSIAHKWILIIIFWVEKCFINEQTMEYDIFATTLYPPFKEGRNTKMTSMFFAMLMANRDWGLSICERYRKAMIHSGKYGLGYLQGVASLEQLKFEFID